MGETLQQAGQLIYTLDPNLMECIRTTLICSVTATVAAVIVGVPLAVLLGRKSFPGRNVLVLTAHTGMAVPTVVLGLLLYGLISRTGPLGELRVLYTRKAIIIGEFALALPIIVALFSSATAGLAPKLEMTARTLGAGRFRTFSTVVGEAKVGLIAATMSAFGRVCSELGIAMMVGGNIKYHTRTMTTAIAMDTAGGEFALALALGLILLLIALGINVAAQVFRLPTQRRYADVL
jgi:tungstate transport system permease protein